LIDMLHMGFVDEVIFGREVMARIPELARGWKQEFDRLAKTFNEPLTALDVTATGEDIV